MSLEFELGNIDVDRLLVAFETTASRAETPHEEDQMMDVVHEQFPALTVIWDALDDHADSIILPQQTREGIKLGARLLVNCLTEYALAESMREAFPDIPEPAVE